MAGPTANFASSAIIFIISALLIGLLSLANQLTTDQATGILFFSRANDLALLEFSDALQNVYIWVITFTNRIWVANFILALISLIPLPPFDGFTAILSLIGLIKEKRINDLSEEPLPIPQESTLIKPEQNTNKKESIADIHFRLGTEYHQQQKFDDAIARYRQAIRADSTFGPAYVNMGLAYKAKDQRQEAIQALKGATSYATDEKSKTQAWVELHSLSAVPDSPLNGQISDERSGKEPWTDITPAPDWLYFGAGVIMLILIFSCIASLLLTTLISGGS